MVEQVGVIDPIVVNIDAREPNDLSNGTLKSGRPVKMFDRAEMRAFDVSSDLVVDAVSGRTLTLLQNWNRAPKR